MRLLMAVLVLGALVTAVEADEREPEATTWPAALRVRGRLAEEFAYRLHDPGDVSKLKTLGWLEGKYTFSESVNLRAAVRGWYDAVFAATDRYPANVERDQERSLSLREAILSVSHGDLDVRAGRQQIVWGEALSTFITDVVNPKDFREFVLPDFTELRIPIWALDATYRLARNVTLEGVWTPDTMKNRLPKQGAEFQFQGPEFRFRNPVVRLPDDEDEFSLARSEGGARLSVLREGWDVSLIYYDQADKTRVLFQRQVPNPPGPSQIVLDPRHPRLHIVGATLAKSFEPVVVRSEVAVSVGKRYETTDPLDGDGVVRRDTIDYLVGVDFPLGWDVDAALQLSQKILTGDATHLTRPGVAGRVTTSLALRLTTGFFDNTLNPTVLVVVGVEQADVRVSPRLEWVLGGSVTMAVGADIFEGGRRTLYGQFDRNDRVTFTTTWRF
jgi:Protein of unknown function (DUF1302)